MSTPHIAWAFAQRNLTAAQRLVLIALAERANGERTCFPSEGTVACDCELSRRSVTAAVQYLRDEGLIEVVTDPTERAAILAKAGARRTAKSNVYRILRPINGADNAPHEQANGAKSAHQKASYPQAGTNGAKSAHQPPSDGAKSSSVMRKKQHEYGATIAHESLNESLNEKKRARASESVPAAAPLPPCGAGAAAPTRRDQEAPPPVVATEASVDISAIAAAVAASIRSSRSPQPEAEPYVPIRRGPVDPERTVEQQQAILAAMIAEEALAKAPRVMEAAE